MNQQIPVQNRQHALNRYRPSQNSREFGDSLSNSKKSKNVIRYSFQNIRGFGTHSEHERASQIKQFIENNKVDIMGMAEVNQN